VLALARILRDRGASVGNVVMMGMGEPFLNYDNVLAACRTMHDPDGFNLGARHIAISTAGWVPGIEALAEEPLPLRLALSLHAPTDELREQLMPVTRRFPVARLMQACRDYRDRTGRRVFVEYLLLDGVNDSDADARRLGRLLGAGPAFHVNLIAYNPTASEYSASPQERVAALEEIYAVATVRAQSHAGAPVKPTASRRFPSAKFARVEVEYKASPVLSETSACPAAGV